MHLLKIHKLIEKVKPQCVIVDPITNLISGSTDKEVFSMLMRLIDFLKGAGITAVFISLTSGSGNLETTSVGISSLTDTWILLRDIELNGERNRCLYILKSRGMAHSNQLREFVLTDDGIKLVPAYIGPGGVLTGSSRLSQEAKEKADALERKQATQRKRQEALRKRLALEAQIESLRAEVNDIAREDEQMACEENERERQLDQDRADIAKSRNSRYRE
jgi:circadian clock protein KaiC